MSKVEINVRKETRKACLVEIDYLKLNAKSIYDEPRLWPVLSGRLLEPERQSSFSQLEAVSLRGSEYSQGEYSEALTFAIQRGQGLSKERLAGWLGAVSNNIEGLSASELEKAQNSGSVFGGRPVWPVLSRVDLKVDVSTSLPGAAVVASQGTRYFEAKKRGSLNRHQTRRKFRVFQSDTGTTVYLGQRASNGLLLRIYSLGVHDQPRGIRFELEIGGVGAYSSADIARQSRPQFVQNWHGADGMAFLDWLCVHFGLPTEPMLVFLRAAGYRQRRLVNVLGLDAIMGPPVMYGRKVN